MDSLALLRHDLRDAPRLTPAEQRRLLRKARAGDLAARERLFLSQAHWTWRVAMSYRREASQRSIPFEDVLEQAFICDLYAIDKAWKPGKGALGSAIRWQCRSRLRMLIFGEDRTIRLPAWTYNDKSRGAPLPRAICSLDHLSDKSAWEVPVESDVGCAIEDRDGLAKIERLLARYVAGDGMAENGARDVDMLRRRMRGELLRDIGEDYGVSKQFVNQRVNLVLEYVRKYCS